MKEKCMESGEYISEANRPISVRVIEIQRTPIHWHENVTQILLPLNGPIEIRSNFENTQIAEGQFYFVNNRAVHAVICDTAVQTAVFSVDLNYYESFFPYIKYMFFRSSAFSRADAADQDKVKADFEQEYKIKFRNLLIALLTEVGEGSDPGKSAMFSDKTAYRLVCAMVCEFNWLRFQQGGMRFLTTQQMERYHRIVKYIDENFAEKITLDDIVAKEYITKTHFSHFWKEISTYSFQERLNYERAVRSEVFLLGNMTISDIARKCGFSDVKYYYRSFKYWYGCMPREYRDRSLAYTKLGAAFYEVPADLAACVSRKYADSYFTVQCADEEYLALTTFLENHLKNQELRGSDEKEASGGGGYLTVNPLKPNPEETETLPSINWHTMDLWIDLALHLGVGLQIKLYRGIRRKDLFQLAVEDFLVKAGYRYGSKMLKRWQYMIAFEDSSFFDSANQLEAFIRETVPKAKINFTFE